MIGGEKLTGLLAAKSSPHDNKFAAKEVMFCKRAKRDVMLKQFAQVVGGLPVFSTLYHHAIGVIRHQKWKS
ncbi:MAG: hypothetical protein M5U34_00990 [Chloroflexi bacterium]|nr:hypothetical protein [Chloroflexota bacterium]